MPTQNRYYSSGYLATTLPGGAASSGAVSVASVTNAPSSFPFTMLLDWGLATQEAISVTAITGSGPYTLTCTRGIDGTTAQSHSANALAVHGVTEQDFSEPQVHMNATAAFTDPESGNTIAVHGITSFVVGGNETQTLTNKTLTSPTITGPTFSGTANYTGAITGTTEALTAASLPGAVLTVTNTNTPTGGPNFQLYAFASGDKTTGIYVTGDTVARLAIDSNGKHLWGPGGGTAGDTDLYRSAAATLTTDTAFTAGTTITAGTGLTVTTGNIVVSSGGLTTSGGITIQASGLSVTGGITDTGASDSWLLKGASGILGVLNNLQVGNVTTTMGGGTVAGSGFIGLTNAATQPTGTVASAGLLYAKSGLLNYLNSAGLNSIIVGSQAASTSATTTSSTSITSMASLSVPANDPVAGAQYTITGYGTLTTGGTTGTLTWDMRWGGTGGTLLTTTVMATGTNAPALTASMTNVPFSVSGTVTFRTTTTAVCELTFTWLNSATATTADTTATIVTSTAVTVTTSSAETFTLDATCSNSGTSVTMVASSCERIS